MSRRWSCLVVLLIGCAAPQPAPAQDRPATTGKDRAPAAEQAAPERRLSARVTDRTAEPFELRGVGLWVPEVSLFGGGDGKRASELKLRRGAAEIQVPFGAIARLEVVAVDDEEDRIQVKLELREASGDLKAVEGTIPANLELRGTFASSSLTTTVKLRDVKVVELAPEGA